MTQTAHLLAQKEISQPSYQMNRSYNSGYTQSDWKHRLCNHHCPHPFRTVGEVGTSNSLNFPAASQNNYFGQFLPVTGAAIPSVTSAAGLMRVLPGQFDRFSTVQNWPNAGRATLSRSVTEFEPVVMRYPLAADFAPSGSAPTVDQSGSQLQYLAPNQMANQNVVALPTSALGSFVQPDRFNPYLSSNRAGLPTLDRISTDQPRTLDAAPYSATSNRQLFFPTMTTENAISNPQFPSPMETTKNVIRRLTAPTDQPFSVQSGTDNFAATKIPGQQIAKLFTQPKVVEASFRPVWFGGNYKQPPFLQRQSQPSQNRQLHRLQAKSLGTLTRLQVEIQPLQPGQI